MIIADLPIYDLQKMMRRNKYCWVGRTLLNLHLWVQWTHLGNFTRLQKSLSIGTAWWLTYPSDNISQLG